MLVLPSLQAFDAAHVKKLEQNEPDRKLRGIPGTQLPLAGKSATFACWPPFLPAVHGNVTLGVAVRPRQHVADQLLAKSTRHPRYA